MRDMPMARAGESGPCPARHRGERGGTDVTPEQRGATALLDPTRSEEDRGQHHG